MDFSMKTRSALIASILALTTTQTGCIVGAAMGPSGLPLWVVGSSAALLGTGLSLEGMHIGDSAMAHNGEILMFWGIILDEKNPGHVDHLNRIPLNQTLASKMNVSINDIKNYNSNLRGAVRDASNQLVGDLRGPVARIQKCLKSFGKYDLAQDDQIVALAYDYGFADAAELVKVFSGSKLPAEKLSSFANRLHLSEQDTRILLYTALGIVSE